MHKNEMVKEASLDFHEGCCICGSYEELKAFRRKQICKECRNLARSLKTNENDKNVCNIR